jgi:hypothetical protein
MTDYQTEIECQQFTVQLTNLSLRPEPVPVTLHKAWKKGFPELCAYGNTRSEAVINVLNKYGE